MVHEKVFQVLVIFGKFLNFPASFMTIIRIRGDR